MSTIISGCHRVTGESYLEISGETGPAEASYSFDLPANALSRLDIDQMDSGNLGNLVVVLD